MSAHDTADEVEAMASGWELVSPGTAAMLRRLHKRAVEAERERDALQDATARHHLGLAEIVQAQVNAARADGRAEGLREAADLFQLPWKEWTGRDAAFAILAIIEEEPPHGA